MSTQKMNSDYIEEFDLDINENGSDYINLLTRWIILFIFGIKYYV